MEKMSTVEEKKVKNASETLLLEPPQSPKLNCWIIWRSVAGRTMLLSTM